MPSSPVQFHFLNTSPSLKSRKELKGFVRRIFTREQTALQNIDFIFCSDEYLLTINREFLKHDYYTDIITFNLAGKTAAVEGEVYISIDRVKDNALNLGQFYYLELHRVIFHGCLHLCGYKDKTQKEISIMRGKGKSTSISLFQIVPRGTTGGRANNSPRAGGPHSKRLGKTLFGEDRITFY